MNRRYLPVALGATFALAVAGVASAATFITPPAGTPNLAAAALQATDLAPGAVAGQDGYVTPLSGSGLSAAYSWEFTTASTADGVSYADIGGDVDVGPTTASVSGFLSFEAGLFTTRKGQKLLARDFVKKSPKRDHETLSDVKFSRASDAGVGTASFVESITYKIKHSKTRQVVIAFDDGTAYGDLVLTGASNKAVPQSDAVALATDVDTHIKAVVGATGATGVSG